MNKQTSDRSAAQASLRPADHAEAASGRIGVLLVNVGTPDATDYWSMRRYLKKKSGFRRRRLEREIARSARPAKM